MQYFKKILFSLSSLSYLLISYILVFICSFIYALYDINNLDFFVNRYLSIISIFINVLLIIFIIKKEKIKLKKINIRKIFPYIYFCLSFTILFNLLVIYISNNSNSSNINMFILLISSGIIGPILEELVFRKLIIDKLLKFNSLYKTIIISSLVFSLLHINQLKIIYTFIVGIIYGFVYIKRKNIMDSIIIHSISNMVVLLITNFNNLFLILSILSLIFSVYLIKKENFS